MSDSQLFAENDETLWGFETHAKKELLLAAYPLSCLPQNYNVVRTLKLPISTTVVGYFKICYDLCNLEAFITSSTLLSY